ncbi:FliO/MopB family protein [Thermotalea metallivorans]|uniref:Flagellar protein n=1 Tax=Thermotalea metallivorans TaxID=520762 RepID=A0A140L5D5_9FIRM|nr:flagellar biosynthetic protein FliO [Thermotalea metallivorans]KXG75760.1 hypothetical protein AN619_15140 [Thermotalea metallivorans]
MSHNLGIPVYAASARGWSLLGQIISLMGIFLLILFAAYVTTRFIGKKGAVITGNRNLTVIEKMNLGIDKALYIIAIGENYYLIAAGKHTVELIDKIKKEDIKMLQQERKDENFVKPFDAYLAKFIHGHKVQSEKDVKDSNLFGSKEDLMAKLNKIRRKNQGLHQYTDKDENE